MSSLEAMFVWWLFADGELRVASTTFALVPMVQNCKIHNMTQSLSGYL